MPISKQYTPILHINNFFGTESLDTVSETSDLRLTIIAIIMKSIDSVTTKKKLKNEALDISNTTLNGTENISNLISAVFNAGLENEVGLSRVLRGIKILAIMSIEFILHGVGEFISLLDRQVSNLIGRLFLIGLDDKYPILINMFTLVFTGILFSAWKMLILPFTLAADILDLVTHSFTRLFDNFSHAPLIALFFSLIPTVLLAFEFMSLLSLGAVGAIFAWPVIAVIAVGISISLLAGSLGVELAKPFEEIFTNLKAKDDSNLINFTVSTLSENHENDSKLTVSAVSTQSENHENNAQNFSNSSATSCPALISQNIDHGRALRIAAAGAVSSTSKKLPTLDELLKDPNLQNFINEQDLHPQKGYTALHLAVQRYYECKQCNDVRTKDSYQKIKSLLQHGASHSISDCKGKTAFEYTDDANDLCERLKNEGVNNIPQINNNATVTNDHKNYSFSK